MQTPQERTGKGVADANPRKTLKNPAGFSETQKTQRVFQKPSGFKVKEKVMVMVKEKIKVI